MARKVKDFQPVVMTDLSKEEFEDLHLLAALRDDFVQTIVSNLIRKELKFHAMLLEQVKANSPEMVKNLMKNRRRKGKKKEADEGTKMDFDFMKASSSSS